MRYIDTPRGAGRLQKSLSKQYRFGFGAMGTMTLGEWLRRTPLSHKTARIREYSRKRTQLEYRKLASPTTEYVVWTMDGSGLDVPKIVYDSLDIPERK